MSNCKRTLHTGTTQANDANISTCNFLTNFYQDAGKRTQCRWLMSVICNRSVRTTVETSWVIKKQYQLYATYSTELIICILKKYIFWPHAVLDSFVWAGQSLVPFFFCSRWSSLFIDSYLFCCTWWSKNPDCYWGTVSLWINNCWNKGETKMCLEMVIFKIFHFLHTCLVSLSSKAHPMANKRYVTQTGQCQNEAWGTLYHSLHTAAYLSQNMSWVHQAKQLLSNPLDLRRSAWIFSLDSQYYSDMKHLKEVLTSCCEH